MIFTYNLMRQKCLIITYLRVKETKTLPPIVVTLIGFRSLPISELRRRKLLGNYDILVHTM